MKSKFVYVSYIKTTPEKLWQALTTSEFIKQYWGGMDIKCDWKVGSPWALNFPDGRVAQTFPTNYSRARLESSFPLVSWKVLLAIHLYHSEVSRVANF